MAHDLGAVFLGQALESAGRAGRLLADGEVDAGLAQLTREELIGGVRRGVEAVARAAGVPPLQVFQRLAMAKLEAQVEALEAHQRRASTRWRQSERPPVRDSLQGTDPLMPGTVLVRLAEIVDDDPPLRAALVGLAGDLNDWRATLDRCEEEIGGADDLAKRRRRRRLVRLAAVALLPLTALGAGAWFVRQHLARARVDAVLAGDSCSVDQIAPSDRPHASAEQLEAIERARTACAEEQLRQRREAEARKAAEAKRLAAERSRKAYLERCEKLRRAFEAGELDDEAKGIAGKHAALIDRLASGRFETTDVEAEIGTLPCADSPAAKSIGEAYAKLVAASVSGWLRTSTPSKDVRALLIEHRAAVDSEILLNLGGHIDVAAARALMSGQNAVVARFAILCQLSRSLELPKLGNCIAVLDLAKEQ